MSTTKTRIVKNWITSIFGTLLMFVALAMLILNRVPGFDVNFSWYEMVATTVLGWVFLMAKNSLIEGIFMGIFKVKSED